MPVRENTERSCIVSPHKVPVRLSAPPLKLKAWYACAKHLVAQDTHLEKSEAVKETEVKCFRD